MCELNQDCFLYYKKCDFCNREFIYDNTVINNDKINCPFCKKKLKAEKLSLSELFIEIE